MPDPDGSDSGHEYIKLANFGKKTVNVEDWAVDDGEMGDPIGATAFILEYGLIDPDNELEVEIPSGRFAMNNSGSDTVRLFSPDKKLKDHVSYDKAKEGVAYEKVGESWAWLDEAALEANGQVAGENLPRTGMLLAPLMLSFATLPTF
jgi:hypothetical protein